MQGPLSFYLFIPFYSILLPSSLPSPRATVLICLNVGTIYPRVQMPSYKNVFCCSLCLYFFNVNASRLIPIVNFSLHPRFTPPNLLFLSATQYCSLCFHHILLSTPAVLFTHIASRSQTPQRCQSHPWVCSLVYPGEGLSGVRTLSGLLAVYFRLHYLCVFA